MIPVLRSERLVLRGYTYADFPAFAGMWGDADLNRYIPFAPVKPEECWSRLMGNAYGWCRNGFGNFAVTDLSGKYLGVTGFFRNRRAGMGAEFDRSIQAGWVFSRAARGRGIASEAVALSHDWFDRQPFGGVSVCGMSPDNTASIRVVEKVGYVFERNVRDRWGGAQTMKRAV